MTPSKQGKTAGFRKVVSFLLVAALTITTAAMPAMAANPSPETYTEQAKYVSQGPAKTGTTYYVDGQEGNDAASGKSPKEAWRTLDKVSATTFQPGDHILLRASSVWNGDGEYKQGSAKKNDLKASGNTLWPKGNGTAQNPIVIDLYELDDKGNPVYEANTRPVINGNGTWGLGEKKTLVSAPVMIYNQDGFEFYNLEVTNMPIDQLGDPNAYKRNGDAQRCGILVLEDDQDRQFDHIVIKNCYVHDVQTEHHNKRHDTSYEGLKACGGIIILGHYLNPDADWMVGGKGSNHPTAPESEHGMARVKLNDVLIENNIVQRVGLEGIRTKNHAHYTASGNKFNKTFTNVVIRGNYLEEIAGDGIVMTEVVNGITENNVAKQACDADYGTMNYAGVWSMFADDILFQYNEVYGIRYGYNDGEAYDIDLSCVNNTYQYNYSHHNSGGFMLFMGDQKDSVVRYNISANDGYGRNKGVSADIPGLGSPYAYDSQSIFHYWNKSDNANMPTIYNNTFYVGDGYDTALYGEGNSKDNTGVVARFYNNVIVKEGEGELKFVTHYDKDGSKAVECKMGNKNATIPNMVQNNIIPERMITDLYTKEEFEQGNNIIQPKDAAPVLKIQENKTLLDAMNAQNNNQLPATASNEEIAQFTSTEKIRERASMFQLAENSVAQTAGRTVKGAPASDFFGNSTENRAIDIGAHQASNTIVSTYVKSVEQVSANTTAGEYPVLPETVEVVFVDKKGDVETERKENRAVRWDVIAETQYQQEGTFAVEGSVKGIEEKATATITVTGQMGEIFSQSFDVKQDSYVQAGGGDQAFGSIQGSIGNGEKYGPRSPLGKGFTNNYVVKIKNATDPNYNRRFVVQFDLTGFGKDLKNVKDAYIQLHIARHDSSKLGSSDKERLLNTVRVLDVYDISNDWDEATVTWNTTPGMEKAAANHGPQGKPESQEPDYAQYKPVAHGVYSTKDIVANHDTLEIDVSEYIRSLPEGTTTVSFLIDSPYSTLPGSDVDNGGFDAFSKEGAQAAYEAYKAGQLPATRKDVNGNDLPIVVESGTSLAPSLVLSNVYVTGVKPIVIDTMIGKEVTLPETATLTYSDASEKTVAVTWETVDASEYNKEQTLKVYGRSTVTGMPIIATINIRANHITGFETPAAISAPVGTAMSDLPLPKTLKANVQLVSGEQTTMDVEVLTWRDNEVAYNPSVPGVYYLIANDSDMKIPADYVVNDGVRPQIKVELIGEVTPEPEKPEPTPTATPTAAPNPTIPDKKLPAQTVGTLEMNKGYTGEVGVRVEADVKSFVRVLWNGNVLSPEHYTVEQGSIVVKLKPEFLQTLTAGSYQLKVETLEGYSTVTIKVTETVTPSTPAPQPNAPTNTTPQTGDSGMSAIIVVFMVSLATATTIWNKKKQSNHN